MTETFTNYWKRNLGLGARGAWDWMGVGGKIVDIIIAVAVGFIIGQENIWVIGLITVLVAFAIFGLLSLFFALFIIPFQESRKQENKTKNLESEIEELRKSIAAPDWSSVIGISADIRKTHEGDKIRHGLVVFNRGNEDLIGCFAELERTVLSEVNETGWTIGKDVEFRQYRLNWLDRTLQSSDCKRDIEIGNSGAALLVVEEDIKRKEITLRTCDPKITLKKSMPVRLRLLVRIGGTANGRSVKPILVMVQIILIGGSAGVSANRLNDREHFNRWNNLENASARFAIMDEIERQQNQQKTPKTNQRKRRKK